MNRQDADKDTSKANQYLKRKKNQSSNNNGIWYTPIGLTTVRKLISGVHGIEILIHVECRLFSHFG